MSTYNTPKSAIFSFYRSIRRQVNLLPSEYLRQFFRIKVADDIRGILATRSEEGRRSKLRRVRKELHRIEDANTGSHKAFQKVLDVAYGRIGPLRWSLMKPLLSDPTASPPARIIPAVEKSRPPVYSPELTALLTSEVSRARPLKKKQLEWPSTMPARADPKSEEARLLGPFSKRREVNIHWRYFTTEWKKVLPPLQVVVHDKISGLTESDYQSVVDAGIRPIGFEQTSLHEDTVAIAGDRHVRPPLPKRARKLHESTVEQESKQVMPHLPSRFIRRRYQHLLSRLPVLTYTRSKTDSSGKKGSYSVTTTFTGTGGSVERLRSPSRFAIADSQLREWLPQNYSAPKQ